MGIKGKKLAEFFNHDFEKGCFRLCDSRGHVVYHEDSDEYWYRYDRDSEGNVTYCEDSSKFWSRHEYDSEGNETYYESSNEYWRRYEYDSEGRVTYYESSHGNTRGVSREVVEMTMEEINKLAGKKVKIINNKNK